MGKCSVDGCEKSSYALGLCSKHYQRKLRNGTTESSRPIHSSFYERFWCKVEKRGEDDCWKWMANLRNTGYGVIYRNGAPMSAHRVSYELAYGAIPERPGHAHGYVVMHTCDNRACVNPRHLRLGTQTDNVKDMDAKGRRVLNPNRGEKHHNSRFTDEQRTAIVSDKRGHSEVAREYGTSPQVIFYIRKASGMNPSDYCHSKDKSHAGESNTNSKITADIVRAIRSSTDKPGKLAKVYNIIPEYVTKIRQRKAWAHVE